MYICLELKKTIKILMFSFTLLVALSVFATAAKSDDSKIHAQEDSISLPIIMYHSILKESSQQGKWVLSPDALEQDLKYLKDNGYEAVTTQDLINYVYYDKILPEKPVMITFDDGHYNNLIYALPLLEKYDMKAIVSIVGEYSEKFSETSEHAAAYSYLTWDDIRVLYESGRFEIASHSYSMHNNSSRNGAMKFDGESLDEYEKALTEDLIRLQNALSEKSGVIPITFTYPFGAVSKESVPLLKKIGFAATLTCYEKPNYITNDPECLFGLNRYNRPAGISTEEFMEKALQN